MQQSQKPDFTIELDLNGKICGLDEVGRAPLAGPVVSACAYIKAEHRDNPLWQEINDSKKISKKKRERLYPLIKELAETAIGIADIDEIAELNIYHASLLSMSRAFQTLCEKCDHGFDYALVDGIAAPKIESNVITVIKGDSKSTSIAAASIIAKVYRDRLMEALHEKYPHYAWNKNAGYPTKAHLDGINKFGITEYHRKTFSPVRNFIQFGTTQLQEPLEFQEKSESHNI